MRTVNEKCQYPLKKHLIKLGIWNFKSQNINIIGYLRAIHFGEHNKL